MKNRNRRQVLRNRKNDTVKHVRFKTSPILGIMYEDKHTDVVQLFHRTCLLVGNLLSVSHSGYTGTIGNLVGDVQVLSLHTAPLLSVFNSPLQRFSEGNSR